MSSWDESFSVRYDEWAAEALHGGFAGEPFTEESDTYVFVTRRSVS